MNPNVIIGAILGHFVGDYLLQNQWMAINKSKPGWLGHKACTVHVLLYTLAVCLFTGVWSPLFTLAVALPHWLIDRRGVAWDWMRLKNGFSYDFKGRLYTCTEDVWSIAFAAPVYIMNDNTMHFVCLWLAARYLA